MTYGNGSSALITTRPNDFREYKIVDHLGSTRVVLDSNGAILSTYNYEPFGKPMAKTGLDSRKSFIDKEKDGESGLGNFGVRSFDDGDGRFTSVDPMWEEEYQRDLSPYHYCDNNPLSFVDPTGFHLNSPFDFGASQRHRGQALAHAKQNEWFSAIWHLALSVVTSDNSGINIATVVAVPGKIAANLAEKTAEKMGTTVLGKYPEYVKLASETGAKRFSIPEKIWNKMSSAEQWGANQKFLDRLIGRGDQIILSNAVKDITKVTGSFRKELDYLIGKGYKLSEDGTQLVKGTK